MHVRYPTFDNTDRYGKTSIFLTGVIFLPRRSMVAEIGYSCDNSILSVLKAKIYPCLPI